MEDFTTKIVQRGVFGVTEVTEWSRKYWTEIGKQVSVEGTEDRFVLTVEVRVEVQKPVKQRTRTLWERGGTSEIDR